MHLNIGIECVFHTQNGIPYGSRTRVSTMRGWHPRPLDEGDIFLIYNRLYGIWQDLSLHCELIIS